MSESFTLRFVLPFFFLRYFQYLHKCNPNIKQNKRSSYPQSWRNSSAIVALALCCRLRYAASAMSDHPSSNSCSNSSSVNIIYNKMWIYSRRDIYIANVFSFFLFLTSKISRNLYTMSISSTTLISTFENPNGSRVLTVGFGF